MESRVSQPGCEDTSLGPEQRQTCSGRSFHSFSLKEIVATQMEATLGHWGLFIRGHRGTAKNPLWLMGPHPPALPRTLGSKETHGRTPPLPPVCCYRMQEVRWGGCQWPWVWNVVFGAGLPRFEPWQHHFALASMELFSCSLPRFSHL